MTPFEKAAVNNCDSKNSESSKSNNDDGDVNMNQVKEQTFFDYFREHVQISPNRDLFISDSGENLLAIAACSLRENLDDNSKVNQKQAHPKDFKRGSELDLINFHSDEDLVSSTIGSLEEQNECVSLEEEREIKKETQSSGDRKYLEEKMEASKKILLEQDQNENCDELSEILQEGNYVKHETQANLLLNNANIPSHSLKPRNESLFSKLHFLTHILPCSSEIKCSANTLPKVVESQQTSNSYSVSDSVLLDDGIRNKGQKDVALDIFSDHPKKDDKVRANIFHREQENSITVDFSCSMQNIGFDKKVEPEKFVTQERRTQSEPCIRAKMNLNELAEYHQVPQKLASVKSRYKETSNLNRTVTKACLLSKSREREHSHIRYKSDYKVNKTQEKNNLGKVNFKHSERNQSLLRNTNSVIQTDKKLFNNSLNEAKRSSLVKYPFYSTKKPKKKSRSMKYLSEKKVNNGSHQQQLEESRLNNAIKQVKNSPVISDDVHDNIDFNDGLENCEFSTSLCDSKSKIVLKESDQNTINKEDIGNTMDFFRNRKPVMNGNCPKCSKPPKKEIPNSYNPKKLLTKDSPLHTYYKERRLRSKPRSVDRTKRKTLSFSRKLEKLVNKRVMFTEDNSIFSYDPNESIYESFCNVSTKDFRQQNGYKNIEKTVRSNLEFTIRDETNDKNVTEITAEEEYAQGREKLKPAAELNDVEKINDTEGSKGTKEYDNLGFVDVPSFDCLLDFEQTNSVLNTHATFDENVQLLSGDKNSTVFQKFNRFTEMSKIAECNVKRWFKDNVLSHKKKKSTKFHK